VRTQGIENQEYTDAGGGSCAVGMTYIASATCTVNVALIPQYAGARLGAVVLIDVNGNVIGSGVLFGIAALPQAVFLPATTLAIATSSIYPSVVAADGSGNLYYSDGAGNNIYMSTFAHGVYMQMLVASGFSAVAGLAVDGGGNLFVADRGAGAVYMEALSNGSYTQTQIGSGFSAPAGLAVDGSGDVYVADAGNQNVYLLTPSNGSYNQSVIAQSSSLSLLSQWTPAGVAVVASAGPDTPVFVWDAGQSRVYMLTLNEDGSSTYDVNAVSSPSVTGVVADSSGNLYLATNSGIYRGGVSLQQSGCSGNASSCEVFSGGLISSAIPASGNFAVDGSGNVYYGGLHASAAQAAVVKLDVADPPTLSFATTVAGSTSTDSPRTVTISNIGTAALQFSAVSFPADFPENAVAKNDCVSSTSLAASSNNDEGQWTAGAGCTLTINFSPVGSDATDASTQLSESVTVATNTPNASGVQSISVAGTETRITPSLSLSSSVAGAFANDPITFNVRVASNGEALPGAVDFYSGSALLGTTTLSTGAGQLTIRSLPLGESTVTAVYSGSTVYMQATSNAVTVTVSQPVSAVALKSSENPGTVGSVVQFTATVTGTDSLTTPTGSVTLSRPVYLAASASPQTYSQQGWATDGVYNYTFDTTRIFKRDNSSSWSAIATNSSPFVGMTPGITHLGDGEYWNGNLYVPAENYGYAGSCTFRYQALAVYSATADGLPLVNWRDISADGHEVSAVAVVSPQNALYVSSFCDGSKLWIYDLTTLKLTGTLILSDNIRMIQGVSYNSASNSLYLSADNNSGKGGEIYSVSLAGVVTPIYEVDSPDELEGIDFTQNALGYMIDQQVHFLSSSATSLGTATLNGGVATLSISTLTSGISPITATYSGDVSYSKAVSNVISQRMFRAAPTAVLSSSVITGVAGSSVTLQCTVTGSGPTPTGSVQFYSGNALLGSALLSNGVATFITNMPAAGTVSINASYFGDFNYVIATSNTISISASKTVPNITLSLLTAPSSASHFVTLNVTVIGNGPEPSGAVAIYSGTKQLGMAILHGGAASLLTNALTAGMNSVTATYSGDVNYGKAVSNVVSVNISGASSSVLLSSSSATVTADQSATFKVTVSGNGPTPTGTVAFYCKSVRLGVATLNSGMANFTTSVLKAGADSVTAVYSGDLIYLRAASNSIVESVAKSKH
jgi:hypothetical protein